MTREEIRTKWIRNTTLLKLDECVDNAMDQYAKQVAIGFYNFMETYQQMGAMGYAKRLTQEQLRTLDKWPDLDTLEYFSFEQLFDQYIDSLNK